MMKYTVSLALMILIALPIYGQQTVGLFLNDSLSQNGYSLFSSNRNTYLIDNCGKYINHWTSTVAPGLATYLLDDGSIMRAGRVNASFSAGGVGGLIQIKDWDDNLTWQFRYANDEVHHHHDMEMMPNGNILMIAWEKKTQFESLDAGRDPNFLSNGGMWPDHIIEVTPVGVDSATIVWEWHLWDHLIQDFDASLDNFGVVADHPELLNINVLGSSGSSDWSHFNSVCYNEDLDQIILSSRHFSEIYIIDHSTTTAEAASHTGGRWGKGGDILYRYGNPRNYGRGDNMDRVLYGQHDAKWIPEGYPDEGKIMVFNNGTGRPDGNYSTVDVWEPPVDSVGNYIIEDSEAFGPDSLFWSYVADPNMALFSTNMAGASRMKNGNTLICEAVKGRFLEVTMDGELVWEYLNPIAFNGPVVQGTNAFGSCFRVERYLTDYAGFEGKDLTPGEPLELEPIPYTCKIYGDSLSTSINPELIKPGFSFFPNPSTGMLNVNVERKGTLQIFDIVGTLKNNIKVQGEINNEIDLSHLENGVYFISYENKEIKKLIISR